MPLDVGALGCDMLSATGRKFLRGPRGMGFLYVRQGLLERLHPPFVDLLAADWRPDGGYDLRPDARRFENWETNYAAKLGLGAAIDYALAWGLESIQNRSWALAAMLRQQLSSLPGVTVRDQGRERCAIVTFELNGHPPADVVRDCLGAGFNVSLSIAAYSRLDYDARGLDALVRASPHYYNTEAEITALVHHIARLAARGMSHT